MYLKNYILHLARTVVVQEPSIILSAISNVVAATYVSIMALHVRPIHVDLHFPLHWVVMVKKYDNVLSMLLESEE